MEKKTTRKDYFEALKAMVEGVDMVGAYPAEDVIAFINKSIEQIDNKAAKAKEKAGEKKAQGDALRETVLSVLTEDFQTADAITAQIEDAEVTRAKVIARLTQLVGVGLAQKDDVSVDGRKVKGYALAAQDAE